MEENLEIEFKILITKDIYEQILNEHHSDNSYWQTNYYLLHPTLSKLRYSLRIREKNQQYELTLKEPQTMGTLENNLNIDQATKDKIINHELVENEIFTKLKPLQLDSTMFDTNSTLTTLRHEIKTTNGLICLDYSQYNQNEDYELEYEVNDPYTGKQAFLDFIKQYHLTYQQNCLSKIKRVINSRK